MFRRSVDDKLAELMRAAFLMAPCGGRGALREVVLVDESACDRWTGRLPPEVLEAMTHAPPGVARVRVVRALPWRFCWPNGFSRGRRASLVACPPRAGA